MKHFYLSFIAKTIICLAFIAGNGLLANGQTCPSSSTTILTSNPNTYYPGLDASISAGSKSITLGAAGSGSTPIASGDLLLLIQMQGAQINSSNGTSYGDGVSGGVASGYLNNTNMLAGNMEYVVATNAVPVTGGTLKLQSGTTKKYKNADYSTDGQYRFQVIRVGVYYNLTLGATITAPNWNGTTGGVLVLSVTKTLNFNLQTLSASGAGFRGGAARQLKGGTTGSDTDYVSLSTENFHGSKGEGIAGTPRFVNYNNAQVDNGAAYEGYPNGSYAAGAPGNAGGGGTDGHPTSNDQNSGGGGGGNGGVGGKGGNSWSSNLTTGGEQGGRFQQASASGMVMGGGGGAGTTNDGTGFFALGFSSSGASGGGIVLVTATTITGTGTIDVSGGSGNLTVLNDGSGGGGAGGSVLLYAGSGQSNVTVKANGGNGGTNTGTGSPHGPGGGGGGGVVYSNGALNAASTVAAGTAGFTAGSSNYGAVAGAAGVLVQNVTKANVPTQSLSCTLLPISFLDVAAKTGSNANIIDWSVENETGTEQYILEKSTDGTHFSTVAAVNYKTSAAAVNSYSYADNNTGYNGTVYYRVRELSFNGADVYSKVLTITLSNAGGASIAVSPNPVANETATVHLKTDAGSTASVLLRLISLQGKVIWQQAYQPGTSTIQLNHLTMLPNGAYLLQYYNGVQVETTKVVISH